MTLTLDPTIAGIPETAERTQLDLMSGQLMVREEGIDWGDAEVEQFKAELRRGALPADLRVPNRTIQMAVRVGPTNFATARRQLQEKIGLIQREGGWLQRSRTGVGNLFADVVNASLLLPDSWLSEHQDVEPEAFLTLETLPDFYGAESQLATLALGAHSSELLLTVADVDGDFPTRMRVELTSDSTEKGLIFAMRSRQTSGATTNLGYDPADLTLLGATTDNLDGTVTNSALVDEWQAILSSDISGTGPMQHLGPHRIWIRASTSDPNNPPRLRLEWHQGDRTRPNPTEHRSVDVPSGGAFLLDLGEGLPRRSPGTQGWGWTLSARSPQTGGDVTLSRVYVLPTGEGYGRIVAAAAQSNAEIVALDSMEGHTPGDLSTKTAPLGGAWSGSGDTDDFFIPNPVDGWVHRTAVSDSLNVGRWARLGTGTLANVQVQADVEYRRFGDFDLAQGIFARFTDVNNYIRAFYTASSAGQANETTVIVVRMFVVGVLSTLESIHMPPLSDGAVRTLILRITDDGAYTVIEGPAGGTLTTIAEGSDSDLATGGGIATGGYGLYDEDINAFSPLVRRYRNVIVRDLAAAGPEDAVLYPNLEGQLTDDGYFREEPTNNIPSPLPILGQRPRLPVSGLEARPVEVFIRPTSGNLSTTADELGAQHSATLFGRPSYLTTP